MGNSKNKAIDKIYLLNQLKSFYKTIIEPEIKKAASQGSSGGSESFKPVKVKFEDDGSIFETDADNNYKLTVFNPDGTISEILANSEGEVVSINTTRFNADGTIDIITS